MLNDSHTEALKAKHAGIERMIHDDNPNEGVDDHRKGYSRRSPGPRPQCDCGRRERAAGPNATAYRRWVALSPRASHQHGDSDEHRQDEGQVPHHHKLHTPH